MKVEVKRLGVLRMGIFLAVFYGLSMLVFLPFMAISIFAGPSENAPSGNRFVVFFMILLYPLIGFIGGLIMAVFYNLAARVTGGMKLEMDAEQLWQSSSPQDAEPIN